MDERLSKLLDNLVSLLEKTGEFVIEQAPPLAREIIAYGRALETTAVVLPLLITICLSIYWFKWSKRDFKYLQEGEKKYPSGLPNGGVPKLIRLIAFGVVLLPSNIIFFCNLPSFFKV